MDKRPARKHHQKTLVLTYRNPGPVGRGVSVVPVVDGVPCQGNGVQLPGGRILPAPWEGKGMRPMDLKRIVIVTIVGMMGWWLVLSPVHSARGKGKTPVGWVSTDTKGVRK
jgi:hypothetical protein